MIPPDTGPLGNFSKNVIHSPIRQLSQICCPVNQHSVLVKEINDYIYNIDDSVFLLTFLFFKVMCSDFQGLEIGF